MSGNIHRLYPENEEPVSDYGGSAGAYRDTRVSGHTGGVEGPSSLAGDAAPPHDSGMSDERISKLEKSINRVEGLLDGLRAVPQLAVTVTGIVMGALAIVVTVGIFTLNNLGSQVKDVAAKVDAIPKQLTEEFRATRLETAAQTAAIANSITAARQVQPQILIMPPMPAQTPSAPGSPTGPTAPKP